MDINNWAGSLERKEGRLYFCDQEKHVNLKKESDEKGIRCYGAKGGRFLRFIGLSEKIEKGDQVYYVNKSSFKKWLASQAGISSNQIKKSKIKDLWDKCFQTTKEASLSSQSSSEEVHADPKEQWVQFVNERRNSNSQAVFNAFAKASGNRMVFDRLIDQLKRDNPNGEIFFKTAQEEAIKLGLFQEDVFGIEGLKEKNYQDAIMRLVEIERLAFGDFGEDENPNPGSDQPWFRFPNSLAMVFSDEKSFNAQLKKAEENKNLHLPQGFSERMKADRLRLIGMHLREQFLKVDEFANSEIDETYRDSFLKVVKEDLIHASDLKAFRLRVECNLYEKKIHIDGSVLENFYDFIAGLKIFHQSTGQLIDIIAPSPADVMRMYCDAFHIEDAKAQEHTRFIEALFKKEPIDLEEVGVKIHGYCQENALQYPNALITKILGAYELKSITPQTQVDLQSVVIIAPQKEIKVEIVFRGDILKKQAFDAEGKTAVVNPANSWMRFGGVGLNAAFSSYSGVTEQDWKKQADSAVPAGEGFGELQPSGRLKIGQAALGLTIGNAEEQMTLIHALGPDLAQDQDLRRFIENEYNNPNHTRPYALELFKGFVTKKGGLQEQVKEAYKSALEVAAKNGCVNVQMPEISTGVFAGILGSGQRLLIWRQLVHEAFSQAVSEFASEDSTIKEVKLVVYQDLPSEELVSKVIPRGKNLVNALAMRFPVEKAIKNAALREKVLQAAGDAENVEDFENKLKGIQDITDTIRLTLVDQFKLLLNGESFEIMGNRRPGSNIEIAIEIARLPESCKRLSEDNLPEFLDLVNQYTLQKPYPCAPNHVMKSSNEAIHRPNHNGTHSMRQLRHVEALFEVMESQGAQGEGYQALASLSEEEKLHLKLAAYFLRAGRVDETNHRSQSPDDYYTRSAMIYEAYAKQLQGVKQETIDWIKLLIKNATKPSQIWDQEMHGDNKVKNQFAYVILTTSHELDLVRCYDQRYIWDKVNSSIGPNLAIYLGNQCGNQVKNLITFARNLCAATGAPIMFLGSSAYTDQQRFEMCSLSGKVCYEQVQKVKQ